MPSSPSPSRRDSRSRGQACQARVSPSAPQRCSWRMTARGAGRCRRNLWGAARWAGRPDRAIRSATARRRALAVDDAPATEDPPCRDPDHRSLRRRGGSASHRGRRELDGWMDRCGRVVHQLRAGNHRGARAQSVSQVPSRSLAASGQRTRPRRGRACGNAGGCGDRARTGAGRDRRDSTRCRHGCCCGCAGPPETPEIGRLVTGLGECAHLDVSAVALAVRAFR